MSPLPVFWLIFLVACTGASENDQPAVCNAGYRYLDSNVTVKFESCRGKCIVKCCPDKQILLKEKNATKGSITTSCVESDYLMKQYKMIDVNDYSKAKIDIYSNKDYKTNPIKAEKRLSDFVFIFSERFLSMECTLDLKKYFPPEEHNSYYLLEDGSMSTWSSNELNPWNKYGANDFCVENQVALDEEGALVSPVPEVIFLALITSAHDSESLVQYTLYGMLTSCVFLALTLWVYTVLPKLRNLPGKMTMALVSALLASFLCRCILYFSSPSETVCSVFSIFLIYFLLSSFVWMIVLSYRVSSTMRPFSTTTSSRWTKRKQKSKFLKYCLIAFGVPLIEIVFIIVVEHLDLTNVPAFVKPRIIYRIKRCFLDDDERRLYLNIPITITVVCNVYFFARALYAYCRTMTAIKRDTPADSTTNQGNKTKNIHLVVKLMVIMGITWIFEIIGSEIGQDSPVMTVFDVYNTLCGLAIFILFVCKKDNLKQLSKKFKIFRPLARRCGITEFIDEQDFETVATDSGYRPTNSSVQISRN